MQEPPATDGPPAAAVSALPLATLTALPEPVASPLPAQCPARWALRPDGGVDRSIGDRCPLELRSAVDAAMARWTFQPVAAPTTAEVTFYLYNANSPTWLVAGPELREMHWTEAQVKMRVTPKYPEEARGKGLAASCAVRLYVDQKGKVFYVEPRECPPEFHASVMDAAYRSTFYPVKDAAGQPQLFWFAMMYKFVQG